MVRLAISVEGQTEERFVDQLLRPHLLSMNIYVTPVLLNGRGGDVSISNVRKDLNKLARSFDKVSTLYDFYGFTDKSDEDDKSSLEEKIKLSVSERLRNKVIPYIQMYEFEGLLFTSPEIIANYLIGDNLNHWARRVLQKFGGNPERINDSQQTAPSKRLEQGTNYIKTIHGPVIIRDIGLRKVRENCLGFDEWLLSLEALSSA